MKTPVRTRLLSALLSLVMLVSLLPVSVFAADPVSKSATLVTDASALKAGDQIVLSATANGSTFAAGAMSGKYLSSVETKLDALDEKVEIFTLGGTAGAWTLTASDGKKISAVKAKEMSNSGNGTDTWTIAIDENGAATVASTDTACGRILYNVNSPRFLNYTSSTNVSMLLPSIYKLDTAPVRESGIVTDLTDLQDGDKVVVFNPKFGKSLSTEYNGFYNKGNDVALADGKLTGYTNVDLWTLGKNDDGTYTFATAEGKKLSMGTGYTSTPLDDVNQSWKITAVDGKDALYYIDNAARTDKYRLQWYDKNGNWSAYTGTGDAFELQLYLVVDTQEPDQPDQPDDPVLADGKYVIYNPGSGKAMSAEATGTYYRAGKDVTVADGKVNNPAEDLIWTVTSQDGVYTITTSDGKKLSMNDEKNSLPLDEANDTWQIVKAATDGCFYIVNATRKGTNGDPYYVEWYANTSKGFEEFSTYFYKAANEGIYAMQFIPAEQPLVPDGKYVIYNPGSGKAMSSEATGTYYRAGKDVTVADGKVNNPSADLIWTVTSQDGVYTITTSDGKKLSMNNEKNSLPLDEANDTWQIAEAATDGCFYIMNATRKGTNGDPYYVEWYANTSKGFEEFSTYFYKAASEGIYAMQFIPAEAQSSGDLPQEGAEVVLFNQNAQGVLAEQNDNTDSPAINKADATIEDGKAVCGNGAVVFTVEKNGEYYRFHNKTYGYLCANGTGNNAFYSLTASEDADWLVRECSGNVGGYELESRTAKYNGKYSQWLEYYSDSFKVYSMYNVTDYTIYSFSFYPVGAGTVVDGIVNNPTVDFGTVAPAYVGQDYELTFTVDAPFGVQGDMTAKLGDGTALAVTLGEDGTYTVHIPDALVTGEKLTVTVKGTDNKDIPISGTVEIEVKDEPVFSDPKPMRGAQTGSDKRPVISAELSNAGENPTVEMTVNGEKVNAVYADGRVTYTPAADMTDGRANVTVTATRADGKSASFSWFFTVGESQYQLYFGQLHSHTQYSDGAGSLESALSYVKNLPASANVQFVAFTDHSNYFDKSGAANPEGALYDMSLATPYSQETWNSYRSAVAAFNEANAGSLVALAGFEMTWSGGPGHINTFNTPGIVSRNNTTLNNKTDYAGMRAYYALLSQQEGADSLSQFNHPGNTFGTFGDFAFWDPVIDSRMYMVEAGNGEGQIGAGGYYPSYEYYTMALDKGWHLAPTNNQDNHKGRWGNANDARDVILTDDFSEEGIYDALRAMRVYATEDKNLEIGYTVNGMLLGSSLTEVPEKLDIHVTVNDPDANDSITKVEVIVNSGKTAYTWDDPAVLATGDLSVTLDPDYSYYYIRVTEGDGDLAVTAPVWVGETLKLGISDVTCGTSTPVTGEKMTVTTTLFNSESTDAKIKSITYAVGSQVLTSATDVGTVPASGTLALSYDISFDTARVYKVTATVVLEQDGKEYVFTKDITLDVLNADDLVYIGIDASHYNEYVAGNYKDSMGNFGNLAGQYNVRTVELKTSDDLIAACSNPKYKALILTAPSRRLADAQTDPRTYSAAELAAIAAFNSNGGTVILAGWSDNYENYDVIQNNPAIKHMAATQNEVLQALGSSLRISDDATYDDVRSAADGVDKWRLYFNTYGQSFLTDGVEVDPDHPYDRLYTEVFSHYGGASVYAVDADGNPTSALPATVSPVVYAHPTTYSVDVDKDGLGGANVPKYAYAENDSRLLAMASEQLEGKGLIIVSGAAFMSNFEVQATISDNGSEKNYSNYKICENLLGRINPVKITDIATVQAQTEAGHKYTIEGVVTSNASGYDKATAFFDCIYVQDETGGINCFPVAGDFKIGDVVRVTGVTDSYQGENELQVSSIEKIGETTPVTPRIVTSTQINDGSVLGQLVTLNGYVTGYEMADGLVQTILVRDSEGNVARVFIDGYITTSYDVANLSVGCQISATGLASYDNTFVLEDGTAMAPRIRVRDRNDVVCTAHEHTFGEWTVTTQPTCTEPGEKTRTCAGCGEVETMVIDALGHDTEVVGVKAATCTEAGYTGDQVCKTCGQVVELGEAIPATGHHYKDGKCTDCGAADPDYQPGVKTGDESNTTMWIIVLVCAAALAVVLIVVSRKKRNS